MSIRRSGRKKQPRKQTKEKQNIGEGVVGTATTARTNRGGRDPPPHLTPNFVDGQRSTDAHTLHVEHLERSSQGLMYLVFRIASRENEN